MKILTMSLMAVLVAACSHASQGTPPRGPDFVETHPAKSAVAPSVAASDATRPIEPTDVVQFPLASAELDSAAEGQIARSVQFLMKNHDERIVLEGHTDRSGGAAYNEDLALRRADAVRDRIVAAGISPDRVVLAVFGEAQADPGVNSYDRRVVMFASHHPRAVVVREELAKERARSVIYSDHGQMAVVAAGSDDVSRR